MEMLNKVITIPYNHQELFLIPIIRDEDFPTIVIHYLNLNIEIFNNLLHHLYPSLRKI